MFYKNQLRLHDHAGSVSSFRGLEASLVHVLHNYTAASQACRLSRNDGAKLIKVYHCKRKFLDSLFLKKNQQHMSHQSAHHKSCHWFQFAFKTIRNVSENA